LRAIEIREQEEENVVGCRREEREKKRERLDRGMGIIVSPGRDRECTDDRVHPPGARARRKG